MGFGFRQKISANPSGFVSALQTSARVAKGTLDAVDMRYHEKNCVVLIPRSYPNQHPSAEWMGRDLFLTSYHWRTTDTCSVVNASGNTNHFNVLMKFWLLILSWT